MVDVVMRRFKLEEIDSRLILMLDDFLAAKADAAKFVLHFVTVLSHILLH